MVDEYYSVLVIQTRFKSENIELILHIKALVPPEMCIKGTHLWEWLTNTIQF